MSQILTHMFSRILDAQLESNPFYHIYIENILPDDVYRNLLANMPPISCYSPLDPVKYAKPDGTPTRQHMFVKKRLEEGNTLPSECDAVVRPIFDVVNSPGLKTAVFNKLAPGLAHRFGIQKHEVIKLHADADVRFMRDTEDYEILPHRDTMYKLVTMQLYLAPDNSQMDLGTSLYREVSGGTGEPVEYEEVKRFPFKPNSAYAFVVSKTEPYVSWHGRQKLAGFTGVRNTLMVIFENRVTQ